MKHNSTVETTDTFVVGPDKSSHSNEYDHHELEKGGGHTEVVPADELEEVIRAEHEFTDAEYKKLMRKVDA